MNRSRGSSGSGSREKDSQKTGKVPGTALAAALVLLLSAVTATGAAVCSWSPKVAEEFQADQDQQDLLTKSTTTWPLDIAVTNGGVTVSLEQA